MKLGILSVAAVALASAAVGTTNQGVAFAMTDANGGPHLRALEEAKPATESAEAGPQLSDAQPPALESLPRADATKGELEQFHGGWGCRPGAWNWPQCRWGGGWGCYPGSWGWPSCRWQHRCQPGSWYWPRCRYW